MVALIRLKGETGTWLPTPIERLDSLLIKGIYAGLGYRHPYALRRNVAYNLQHLQFLDQIIQDVKLTTVLITQTWKTSIIVGCGVIESILHYFLTTSGNHATTDWELLCIASGNPRQVNGSTIKIDSYVYRRLGHPKQEQMTFDAMLKKAEKRRVLGQDHSVYSKLNRLRNLRNRVHLQEIGAPTDTDWNAFKEPDYRLMMQVVHAVFTGTRFSPSTDELAYFNYLEKYL
jgi:hypothetical protein